MNTRALQSNDPNVHQFPDVVQIEGNLYCLVTDDSLMWVRWNTNLRDIQRGPCKIQACLIKSMIDDGLAVCLVRHR